MLSINIQYFASLREQAGLDHEIFTGTFASNKELYQKLSEKHGFVLPADMIQVAVNDEFASMNDAVVQGSKIVFIPPMAGG